MFVEVDLAQPGAAVTVRDADDFSSFKVVVAGGDPRSPKFARAIADLGRLDADGHAWLSAKLVQQLPGARVGDPAWAASFGAMLGYAAAHGFYDADQGLVRAHCEAA